MVRTRGKEGSIVKRGQPRRRASTSRHGQLAIDLRRILYSGLSTWSNGGSPHSTSHSSSPSSSIPYLSPHSSTLSLSPHSSTPSLATLSSNPHTYIPSSLRPPDTSPPYFTPQPLSYAGTAHQGCHTYYPASPSLSILAGHQSWTTPLHLTTTPFMQSTHPPFVHSIIPPFVQHTPPSFGHPTALSSCSPPLLPSCSPLLLSHRSPLILLLTLHLVALPMLVAQCSHWVTIVTMPQLLLLIMRCLLMRFDVILVEGSSSSL